MVKVYAKETQTTDFDELGKIAQTLLKRVIEENDIRFDEHVPIKVHFGEDGNITYVPATAYDGMIEYLSSKNVQTSFIETNVLYRGRRTNRADHVKLALEHGFDKIPIIIADGEMGEMFYDAEINKEYLQKCKIGAGFKNFRQYIVCAHFKGHALSGFGGAIKQLGMGFAARGGKLEQHSSLKPTIIEKKCTYCSLCLSICPVNAITVESNPVINKDDCIGCAVCIACCPSGAVVFDWEGQDFLGKLVEYAYAAAVGKQNIYVNFLANITKDCDCMGIKMNKITENVGVLVSTDPVAIDTASIDLVQKRSGSKIFDKGRSALEHADRIGLGSMKYKLILGD